MNIVFDEIPGTTQWNDHMWSLRGTIFNNSSHFKGLICTIENKWKMYDGLDKEQKLYDWTTKRKMQIDVCKEEDMGWFV